MKQIPILMAIGILGILVLAQLNYLPSIVSVGNNIPFSDKIGHFFMFGGLALIVKAYTKTKWNWFSFVFVTLFALADELLQHSLPYRSFNPMDFLAGFAGILTVEVLSTWLKHQKIIRQ